MLKVYVQYQTPAEGEIVNTNEGPAFYKKGKWTLVMKSSYPTYPVMTVPARHIEWWETAVEEVSVEEELPALNVKVMTDKGIAVFTEKGWVRVLPSTYANYPEMWVPDSDIKYWCSISTS